MSGNNGALVCSGLSFDPFSPEFFVVPTESSIRVLVKLAVDLYFACLAFILNFLNFPFAFLN